MPTNQRRKANSRPRTPPTRRGNRKVIGAGRKQVKQATNNKIAQQKNSNSQVEKKKKRNKKPVKSKAAAAQQQRAALKRQQAAVPRVAPFTKAVDLTSLYRQVQANVQFICARLPPASIGDTSGKPARSPGGLAWYLYWAFLDYVRVNGNANDGVPGLNTLPCFGRHWNLPLAFLNFIQGYLRNRTKTIDINAEFGDLTTLFSGTVPTMLSYNATFTQYTGPYGTLVAPSNPGAGLEWLFPTSVTTATQTQLIAIGAEFSDLVAKACPGSMCFESILAADQDEGIQGYNSPILCANPTANGFTSAFPFEEEMAYFCIDTTTNTTTQGTYLKGYPTSSQNRFVLNAVNLLNHMNPPAFDFRGKNGKKMPRRISKILGPGKKAHQWHEWGRLKSLVVCQSFDNTSWNGFSRLVGALSQCIFANQIITAANGEVVNYKKVVEFCLHAFAFVHSLEWGWTYYCLNSMDTSIYVNSITSCQLSGFKDLNVPSIILDWVRSLAYPINQAGRLCLPTMPKVCRSLLANWAGLQVAYANFNDYVWAATASPDGYGSQTDYTGLMSTQCRCTTNFTGAIAFRIGARLSFQLTAANALGTITSTNQSPALPMKLTKMFLLCYDQVMTAQTTFTGLNVSVDPGLLTLFNINFPKRGGVGYHAAVSAIPEVMDMDNGWTVTDWNFVDAQIGVAVDIPTFWRAIDAPRIWNVVTSTTDIEEIYQFRVNMSDVENGITEVITAMKINLGGTQYQSILIGNESNPKLTKVEYKNLLALDHVVDQIHSNRSSPSFMITDMLNGLRLYVLSQKDLKANYSEITYVGGGDGTIFTPHSITGFLTFLGGVAGILRTGAVIFGKVANSIDSILGTKTVSAV